MPKWRPFSGLFTAMSLIVPLIAFLAARPPSRKVAFLCKFASSSSYSGRQMPESVRPKRSLGKRGVKRELAGVLADKNIEEDSKADEVNELSVRTADACPQ